MFFNIIRYITNIRIDNRLKIERKLQHSNPKHIQQPILTADSSNKPSIQPEMRMAANNLSFVSWMFDVLYA